MKASRGFISIGILIAIVAGLAVLGGGAYYVLHQPKAPEAPAETPDVEGNDAAQKPAQTAASPATTYTDADYHFNVQYDPKYFTTTRPATTPFMGLPDYSHTRLNLFYTDANHPPGFDSANITFRASRDATYEDCTRTRADQDGVSTKTVQIGGHAFYKDSFGDAATGHFSQEDSYRSYFDGACYEIHVITNTYRTEDGTNHGGAEFKAIQDRLQSTLESFRFTAADTAPVTHASSVPAWKTYDGVTLPISFSYPGSLIVMQNGSEINVKKGMQIGLDTIQSGDLSSWISIQKGYITAGDSAAHAMQASMKTESVAYPSYAYTPTTLGGESASLGGNPDKTSVIYVLHGDRYYRIVFFGPFLPDQYKTFLATFAFTD